MVAQLQMSKPPATNMMYSLMVTHNQATLRRSGSGCLLIDGFEERNVVWPVE